MSTDPLNPFGNDPLLNPFGKGAGHSAGNSQGGASGSSKSGPGGGGGSNSSRAGERAREDAKQKADQKAWDEDRAAAREKANQEPPSENTTSRPRLARIRFLDKDHQVGDQVGVACDVQDGATAEGVTFSILAKNSKGQWVEVDKVTGKKATQGSESKVLLTKPHDQPDKMAITFKVKATHQGADAIESEAITADPEEDFEGILYYSPQREAYLLLESRDEALPFLEQMQATHDLNQKRLKAWQEPDLQKRNQWLEQVVQESDAMFGGEANVDADKAFDELIRVQGNKAWGKSHEWAYLPAHQGKKGKWIAKKDPEIVKTLEKVRKKTIKQGKKGSPSSEDKEPIWKGSLKAQFFEKELEPYKHWEWAAYHKKKDFLNSEGDKNKENPYFDFSGEAAVMRLMAGWSGPEVEFKPQEGKIELGASGSVSFAVKEGRLSGGVSWPSKAGINILGLLGEIKYKEAFIKKGRGAFMRLHLSGVASYFEGVSIKGALAFPKVDFSKVNQKKKGKGGDSEKSKRKFDVGAKAGASFMVGAQGRFEGALAVQWHMAGASQFDNLALVKVEGGATSGVSGKLDFEIGYVEGKFIFAVSAGLAKGFGGEGGYCYEVAFDEGVVFIGYVLNSVDCRFIKAISTDAFNAFTDYTFAMMVRGVDVVKANALKAVGEVKDFKGWLETTFRASMQETKQVIRAFADRVDLIKRSSPEALGRALFVLMQTREQSDFDPILYILRYSQSEHKLKWVVRESTQEAVPDENAPNYEVEKERLYQLGKKKLFEFGRGIGYPDAKENKTFTNQLQTILG